MQEQNSSTSSFKRFLVRLLLPLVLVLAAAGWLFSYFFERQIIFKTDICGAYKVNRIIGGGQPGEIPIIGSSRAEGCYLPDSLGANYFNYGLSGTKYDVTLFFLDEICRHHNSKYILLNFDLDGLQYGIGDISNYIPNSGYLPVRALMGKDYKAYFSVPFIKYYGCFENYFRMYLSNRKELTKISNKGASIEKNALLPEKFNELVRQRTATPTTFTAEPPLSEKLLHLINTATDRTFIFVIAPYHSSYFAQYKNIETANDFLNRLRSQPNVKVFDFSHLLTADTLFLNTTHINYKGALMFNHVLRDSLAMTGIR